MVSDDYIESLLIESKEKDERTGVRPPIAEDIRKAGGFA